MGRIDTHHHYVTPDYRQFLETTGFFGGQRTPPWSEELSLQLMDELAIDTAILSTARPGFWFGDRSQSREAAREVNEFAANLMRRSPERFGVFAALPLPSVEDALAETQYVYDELNCDGVVMLANCDGVYLGDPSLDPLMEELDKREAVLFVHPNSLPDAAPLQGVPVFVADFLLDTTRAALNLVRHGVLRRFPNIKFVLSHGGGFLPYAAHRVSNLTPVVDGGPANREEFLADCRQFWMDTALTASSESLPTLLKFAEPGRVMYGSDFPYAPGDNSQYFTRELDHAELDSDLRSSIDRGAAETLFPRLATKAL